MSAGCEKAVPNVPFRSSPERISTNNSTSFDGREFRLQVNNSNPQVGQIQPQYQEQNSVFKNHHNSSYTSNLSCVQKLLGQMAKPPAQVVSANLN